MSFQERFKGKFSMIGKEGVAAMIGKKSKPIDKTLNPNQSYMHDSSYSFRSMIVPSKSDRKYDSATTFITPERNNSQVHKLRTEFESERKAHRNNLYRSILRNERSAHANLQKSEMPRDSVKPRWNKSLVGKLETKRKLFVDNNHYSNYSISIPADSDSDLFDRLSDTNRSATIKLGKEKPYDILVIDRSSDIDDYDTSVSLMSNRNSSFRKGQKQSALIDRRAQRAKEGRYKPFNLRDYTKSSPTDMGFRKRGGLGPEIGNKRWQEEKAKRERMRDFSERINRMKKDQLIFNNEL